DDAGEAVALPAQRAIEPEPAFARVRLVREAGADRRDNVGVLDPRPEKVETGWIGREDAVVGVEAQLGQLAPGNPALVGKVVNGQHRRGVTEQWIVGVEQ